MGWDKLNPNVRETEERKCRKTVFLLGEAGDFSLKPTTAAEFFPIWQFFQCCGLKLTRLKWWLVMLPTQCVKNLFLSPPPIKHIFCIAVLDQKYITAILSWHTSEIE